MRGLLVSVVVVLAVPSGALAAANGRLAFATSGNRIVTANPDGTGTRIASFDSDVEPAWAPYAPMLAVAGFDDETSHIYYVGANGKGRGIATTSDAADRDPAWAPCGCFLAFERTRYGDSAIYRTGADGSNAELLADAPGCDADPAFSPDGTQIAFTSCRDGRPQIYVMSVDGTNVTRLTRDAGSDANPSWSPDGRRIAYDSDADGVRRIWIIGVDGTSATAVSWGPFDVAPAWAPDGTQIAYSDIENWVRVLSVAGSSNRLVAFDGETPAWQRVDAVPGCTQNATAADDFVSGGNESDIVCGQGGDDELVGGAGSDIIRAGAGDDSIDARDGEPDFIFGGVGRDTALVDRSDHVSGVDVVRYVEPRNLARGRPATASLSFADGPPSFATDGDRTLWWASNSAPQWIQIDLGRPRTIRRIELVVAQTPRGDTLHVLRWRARPDGPLHLLHTFDAYTEDKDVLVYTPRRPVRGVRYVRVDTYESPSWVAWREIRILR